MPKNLLSTEDQVLRERLGAAIRAISGELGCKPAELAALAGIGLASQYRIEAGETTPDVLYLVKITNRLGISIDELLKRAWEKDERSIADETRQKRSSEASQITQINKGRGARQIVGNVVIAKRKGG
ncbi:helix-turn-helix domain-containing protein [Hylemonella sp. W303a]|uniref:helix-turn-helix domain-containing protein n=1 Tax=Hylemonella sp. W303a TaxID=3389873 RepID=UPI00396AF3B7